MSSSGVLRDLHCVQCRGVAHVEGRSPTEGTENRNRAGGTKVFPCLQARKCLLPCVGGTKQHPFTVLLWSFPCLRAGHRGHLCPSHLVAPDIFKKGSPTWIVEPWDSLALRPPLLLAHGGVLFPAGGTWGGRSMRRTRITMTCGLLLPTAAWRRKRCPWAAPPFG